MRLRFRMFGPLFELWLDDDENFGTKPNNHIVEATANLVVHDMLPFPSEGFENEIRRMAALITSKKVYSLKQKARTGSRKLYTLHSMKTV